MYRRSLVALSQPGRAIVRDPRKAKVPAKVSSAVNSTTKNIQPKESTGTNHIATEQHQHQQQPLPFAPTDQNQSSIGSMVGSYMLAGFGMGLGMVIVRLILGG